MIAAARSKSLILLGVLIVSAKGWELPSFLMENLPSLDQSTNNNDRDLQAKSIAPAVVASEAPTESPAPSPSPSETPTTTPTVTDKPTGKPSVAPTESPAPSPSPSENPTGAPSSTPSEPPTNYPTVSHQPTALPSFSPSKRPSTLPSTSPSSKPTVSMAPSSVPSQKPSAVPSDMPSTQPSSAPTRMSIVTALFTAQLPIESGLLNETQIAAFENATSGFVDVDVAIGSGILQDVIVQVLNQTVVDVSNETTSGVAQTGGRRELTDWSMLSLTQALTLDYTVTALYIGSDNSFDLHKVLSTVFKDPNDRWFAWLSAADAVFQPLAPAPRPEDQAPTKAASQSANSSESGNGPSNGTVVLVSVMAAAALSIGIAASVFSVRHYKRSLYGQELDSPRLSPSGSDSCLGSQIAKENLEYHAQQLQLDSNAEQLKRTKSEEEKEVEVDSTTSSWMNHQPPSPNSLENGGAVAFDQIMRNNPRLVEPLQDRWSQIQPSNRGIRATKDPPSAESEINFSSNESQPPVYQHHANPRNASSLFDNNTEISDMTRSQANHEIKLTRSKGGTLGAAAVDGSNAGSGSGISDFSSHAKSFFSGLVGGQGARVPEQHVPKGQPNGIGSDTLGARAVTPKEDIQLKEQTSYDSMTNRAGLYDVFAPPGPIGIVVDTTKHGPAVHSLKRTSPMLGLINPGDLIVGLDDEDARGMTAATLTRLMARKSNQKERKITLLTVDNL